MTSQYYTNEHIGQSQFHFWYGQVLGDWEKNENNKPHNKDEIPGWGKRYKVAILGRDSRSVDKGASNDELAMCEVLLPVTAGSGLGGGVQTPNIAQNTFVMGFYKDGINCREPVIMGLLPNYSQTLCGTYTSNESERFNPASGYDPSNLSHYTPDYNLWMQFGGHIIKESNDAGFVNGYDASMKKQLDDGKRPRYIPSPYKCQANGGEMFGIAQALQDGINLINQIKQEVLKYSNAISSIQSTIRSIVSTISLQITTLMKNMIQRMRGFVMNQINRGVNVALGLLPANMKSAASTAMDLVMDTLNCVFNKIINELLNKITSLVENAINSAVNMAMSAVENFVGGSLSSILGSITSGIDSALNAAGGILGSALQVAGNPLSALDIVFGFIKFFVCDEELKCPSIQQWSFWFGTNTYNPKVRENVSKVLAGIASTSAGIGTTSVGIGTTSAGIGTTSVGIGSTGNIGIGTNIIGIGTNVIGIGTNVIIPIEGVRQTNDDCSLPEGTAPVLCKPPEIELIDSSGGGLGFKANAIISNGKVIGFDIIDKGSGYTSTPIVSFYSNCGRGSGAVLFPIVSDGQIEDIIVLDGGSGYMSSPDGSTGGGGRVFSTSDQTIAYTPSRNEYDIFIPDELVEFEEGDLIFMPAGTQADLYDIDGNVVQRIVGFGQATCTKIKKHGVLTIPKKIEGTVKTPTDPTNLNPTNLNRTNPTNLNPTNPTKTDGSYPVVLTLKDVLVTNEGVNYKDTDKIIIEPNFGAELNPKFDDFGKLISVEVINGGIGYTESPDIYISSSTGINARMVPVFEVLRVGDLPEDQDIVPYETSIINVVDCVGRVD